MDNEFSVYGFVGEKHTDRRKWVTVEIALTVAQEYVKSGKFDRVIITDGGDFTNMEWTAKDGLTFPTDEQLGSPELIALWHSMFPRKES